MESTKQQSGNDSNLWGDCPAGELQDLSRRLRTAERRRQQSALVRTVGATTAASAALVLAIGMMLGGNSHGNSLTGISCSECQATFAAYHGHLTNGVAMQGISAEQMGNHLMKCNPCQEMYEAKHPGELINAGVITRTTSLGFKPIGLLGYAAAL